MTVYFDIIAIQGISHALFKTIQDDTPVDPSTLTLPDDVEITSYPDLETPVVKTKTAPDFLLDSLLQKSGYLKNGSAALMLQKIGIKVDPNTGHSEPSQTPKTRALGGGLVMTEMPYRSTPYQAPEYTFADEDTQFRVETITDNGKTEIRVGIKTTYEEDWCTVDDLGSYKDAPTFLKDEGCGWMLSSLSEEETREALFILGWSEVENIFIGYTPDELEFGVLPDDTEDSYSLHDGLCIFVNVKTPHPLFGDYPPYEDDLRPFAVINLPDFVIGDTMENTFEIKKGVTKETIIETMTKAGFTYDPEIDDYY